MAEDRNKETNEKIRSTIGKNSKLNNDVNIMI